jgi:hypothetical protein
MNRSQQITGRLVALFLTVAGVWSVGLVVVFADEVERDGGYVVAGVPLVATALVAVLAALAALLRPRAWPVVVAFVVVGPLGCVNLLAMLTIGIFFIPATGALAAAVLLMLTRATPVSPPHTAGLPGRP